MMKKFVVTATVTALVAMSSTCLAGFGLPKIGGTTTTKSPAVATSTESKSSVDTTDISNKQADVLKYMKGALLAQIKAYQVVDEALGNSDKELAQAAASLNSKSGTNIMVHMSRPLFKILSVHQPVKIQAARPL